MFNPVWGGYAEAAAKKDWKWCKSTLKISLIATTVIFVLVIIVLFFFGNYFLQILAGKNYISKQILFLFLGTASLFYILFSVTTTFQNATNRLNFMVVLTIAACFIVFPISKFFIAKYDVTGLAISTSLLWMIMSGLLIIQSFNIINKNLKTSVISDNF